jgi:DNA-binding MarR family transcriptional regulator
MDMDMTPESSSPQEQRRPGKVRSRKYRELWSRPGYLVRRLHQIHIGLFAEACGHEEITPIQFGMLSALENGEEMDQMTLSTAVGVDRVSGADVIRRLERRGLLERNASPRDKRAKLIKITEGGKAYANRVRPMMAKAQTELLKPLTEDEREEFQRLITKLVYENNTASRAPMGSA